MRAREAPSSRCRLVGQVEGRITRIVTTCTARKQTCERTKGGQHYILPLAREGALTEPRPKPSPSRYSTPPRLPIDLIHQSTILLLTIIESVIRRKAVRARETNLNIPLQFAESSFQLSFDARRGGSGVRRSSFNPIGESACHQNTLVDAKSARRERQRLNASSKAF